VVQALAVQLDETSAEAGAESLSSLNAELLIESNDVYIQKLRIS
jgi:hypothetical protein